MNPIEVHDLSFQEYDPCYKAMQEFTLNRDENTMDQIWFVEHSPVYTLGLNSKKEHLLNTHHIPVIETDRGGQVTYHGPGQLIIYFLLDLKRLGLTVKGLVNSLEQTVIDLLNKEYSLIAYRKDGAPGVYIDEKKISALGVRIKRGCCYHGLALNVDMDLLPFAGINPCGYEGLEITQLKQFGINDSIEKVADAFLPVIFNELNSKSNSTCSPLSVAVA